MAWRDTLQELQEELADVRAQRLQRAKEEALQREAQRKRLTELAASLEISRLVAEMNAVLLKGAGAVASYESWDRPAASEADDDDGLLLLEDDDEEEADYVSAELTWEEDGEREIAVDLGIGEEGLYLQVNGIDVRLERPALEQALVEAFREELEL
jgi:hypothetical protein